MNEWDLLSPRYFSDLFVWLFDGGLPALLAVGGLLFFGTLTVPGYVKGRQFLRDKKIDKGNDTLINARIRTHLPLENTPNFFPAEHSNFKWFYGLSFALSLLYFILHFFIARSPATVLTTGARLQWLPADDVRSLIQFLYHWVLTGYALAVLSVALGLDYIARWMKQVLPSASNPSFHLKTRKVVTGTDEGQHSQRNNLVVEETLLLDTAHSVFISDEALIYSYKQNDPLLPRVDVLYIVAEGDQWYVAPAPGQVETFVFQIADRRIPLTEKLLLDRGEVVLTWERQPEKDTNDITTYYCYFVPYFKA